jgi:hypothetical protein
MTTKKEMIEIIRVENPNGLRTGSDETGYVDLSTAEYEAKIAEWADARLAKESAKAESDLAKSSAQAKLAALGLTADDLKALGL